MDTARRTIEVWCEISHPVSELRAGAFGNATIITGMTPKSVLVPLPAVQFQEGTRSGFVMVIDDKHAARKRQVETGEIANNMVPIIKGVNAGELVIVEGGYWLPEGTAVRLAEEKKY